MSVWLIAACQNPEDKQPDNLIPAERMSNILTEVHFAEARVSRLGLAAGDSANVAYKHLEKQIFRRFEVDTATYSKSYAYYSAHPEEMEAIYKVVVKNIEKKMKTAHSRPTPVPADTTKKLPVSLKKILRS